MSFAGIYLLHLALVVRPSAAISGYHPIPHREFFDASWNSQADQADFDQQRVQNVAA